MADASLQYTRHALGDQTLLVVTLPDRRERRHGDEKWLFMWQVSEALYGTHTGALHALLARCSLASAPLSLRRSSSEVTPQEYEQLKTLLEEALSSAGHYESKGRIKNLSILAVNHAVTAAHRLGRSPRTTAFLNALASPQPRAWLLLQEQEENTAAGEVDLLLDEEIEELDETDVHFGDELIQMAAFETLADDEQKADATWKLTRLSGTLKAELEAYVKHRVNPINRARSGSACQDITVGNDRATVLRFLGFTAAEPRNLQPGLGVFTRPDLGALAQQWLEALSSRNLRFSTLANYTNRCSHWDLNPRSCDYTILSRVHPAHSCPDVPVAPLQLKLAERWLSGFGSHC